MRKPPDLFELRLDRLAGIVDQLENKLPMLRAPLIVTARHPQIPVVLMTGKGSEEIAVKALEAGAASYVPKGALHQHLLSTVQDVLEMVRQREASGRAHPWILARVDALLEAEADADTSEHAWGPGPIGTAGQQGRLIDDEDEIAEVEPDDADWASPRDRDWAASDFELDSGADYDDLSVVRDFPIDRYDDLRVTEILPLLATLHPDDLKMVREEEAAGKARASILSRIDGLLVRDGGARQPAGAARRPAAKAPSRAAANLPIDGYDDLTVPQIQARLVGLTAAELRQVRTYEKRHKNRAGVLSRIEGALKQAPR